VTPLDQAYARAAQISRVSVSDLRAAVPWEGDAITFEALITKLTASETSLQQSAQGLERLQALGLDQPADYQAYDKARGGVFQAQVAAYALTVAILNAVPGGSVLVSQLPVPQMAPALSYDEGRTARNYAQATQGAEAGVQGLAGYQVLIGAAILIVVAGAATVAAIVLPTAIKETANVILAVFDTYRFRQMLDARLACINAGNDVATCRQLITEPPPLSRPPGGNGAGQPGWVWAAFGGLGVVITGGLLWYLYERDQRRTGGEDEQSLWGLGAPRRVTDLDGSKSQYNLEIE
jgi:hypothetical protein